MERERERERDEGIVPTEFVPDTGKKEIFDKSECRWKDNTKIGHKEPFEYYCHQRLDFAKSVE
jgi:hypothetical protein